MEKKLTQRSSEVSEKVFDHLFGHLGHQGLTVLHTVYPL